MPEHHIVWRIDETNSVCLILFNLRNRVSYMYERISDSQDFNIEAESQFLADVRGIIESLRLLTAWYENPDRILQ